MTSKPRALLGFLGLGIAWAALMRPAPALAQAGDDVVLLKNGGRLRGVVIEQDPQRGVRIKLADGTVRSLKPADVSEVHFQGDSAAPSSPAAAGPAPVAPAPAPVAPAPAPVAPAPMGAPAPPPAPVGAAPPGTFAPAPAAAGPMPAAPPQSQPSQAPGSPAGHRFVLGARLAYSIPMGDAIGAESISDGMGGTITTPAIALSDAVTSAIPILFEAGYEVTPNVVLGAYFEYSFVNDKTGPLGCPAGFDCPDHDVVVGLQGQYHFSPAQSIDPWLGLGVGYEWDSFSGSGSTTDLNNPGVTHKQTYSGSWKGPEFARLQGGVDFQVAPSFTVGPFCSLAIAQYTSRSYGQVDDGMTTIPETSQDVQNTALHQILTFGVKGAFQIKAN